MMYQTNSIELWDEGGTRGGVMCAVMHSDWRGSIWTYFGEEQLSMQVVKAFSCSMKDWAVSLMDRSPQTDGVSS